MTVSVETRRLLLTADDIRREVATNDLKEHFSSPDVGNFFAGLQLDLFAGATAACPGFMSTQLRAVASAFTLGADDANDADRVEVHTGGAR